MSTVQLENFLGINNRLPDFALSVSSGQFLKDAIDVDIDNAGKIRSRQRETLIQAMTGAHSFYMISDTSGFLVRSGALYSIVLPVYSETLVKLLSNDSPMSYESFGGSVYCSNGTDRGRVVGDNWFPWGLSTPSAPALASIGGNLLPGSYLVGLSYCNAATGEEGGISASARIERTSIGGIRVTLPGATDGATHVCVYVSGANGGVVYYCDMVAAGEATYDVIVTSSGREAPQRHEAPLPAGTVFMSNGRLCSFSGNTVYVGLPYRHGYYLPASGYIPFPSAMTHAVENQGGTYLCTEKSTYWIPGDIAGADASLFEPLPFGAVPGTGFRHPEKQLVGWFSGRGIIIADTQGQAVAKMSDNIDLSPPPYGVSAVTDANYTRVASCGWCMNLDNGAATRYSGWSFSSTSRGYGTKSDGIYQLWQNENVIVSVNLGRVDFGAEQRKRLPYCYLGVEGESPIELRVQTPEGDDYSYSAQDCGELNMQRIEIGRGLRANWFELSLSNPDGIPFALASVAFDAAITHRRLK